MKQKICKQVVMHDIAEGDRIYQRMKQAMLSVTPDIGSTVSMNYALSKLMANYKLMMKLLDIEVESYIGDMMAFWEYQLQHFLVLIITLIKSEDHLDITKYIVKT